MRRDRSTWLDDDADLQVFVPGLMATGILVSIGMLIWDGIKRFLPDVGDRQRAARLAVQTKGRFNDLASIERGEGPSAHRVERVRRPRRSSVVLALTSFAFAAAVSFVTLAAYHAKHGTLAGRGWTLTIGMSIAGPFVLFAATWLVAALMDDELPEWAERAQRHWPVGVLPDLREHDS